MDGIEFLQGAELFQVLTLDQLRAIHGVCQVRRLVPGEVLMEQGKPGQGFHVVRKGTARVSVRTAQGEQPFAAAGPGTPIGVMNLFDYAPSTAQVVAEADLLVLSIAPGRFAALLETDERLSLRIHRHLARTLAARLRSAGDLVVRMGAGGPDQRA